MWRRFSALLVIPALAACSFAAPLGQATAPSAAAQRSAAAPAPSAASRPGSPSPAAAPGDLAALMTPGAPAGSAALREAAWRGIRFRYDPAQYVFAERTPVDPAARAMAVLEQTPNPCEQQPAGSECVPRTVMLSLYPGNGLDLWAWLGQQAGSSTIPPNFTDALVAGRPAATWVGDGILWGSATAYAVPAGEDILYLQGVQMDWFLASLAFEQPDAPQLAVGDEVQTIGDRAWELWTDAAGETRLFERPRLQGGSLVALLADTPEAVQVRTSDGLTGWIKAPAAQALTRQAAIPNTYAPFMTPSRAVITHVRNIPLRKAPRSTAASEGAPLTPGQEIAVLGMRGDWLLVYVDAGLASRLGWARWNYDGTWYIEPVGQ